MASSGTVDAVMNEFDSPRKIASQTRLGIPEGSLCRTSHQQKPLQSPLRYPGGKRQLCGYISEFLKLNELRPKLFVEPFAGGASISLHLLSVGAVERIGLGEKDPLLASFWQTVFNDAEWLIDQIQNIKVDVPTWKRFKHGEHKTVRERALACLFLNRTSFSGILHPGAGPIGGPEQKSQYKVDCRFARQKTVDLIAKAYRLRHKVEFVREADWRETMDLVQGDGGYSNEELFFFLDPPFYAKSPGLYTYHFRFEDHKALSHYMPGVRCPWLVSYDPADAIIKMYSENGFLAKTANIDVIYSAATAMGQHKAVEFMITNQPILKKKDLVL